MLPPKCSNHSLILEIFSRKDGEKIRFTENMLHARHCTAAVESLSCVPLFAAPWTVAHGISQARILEWVAISFSRGSSWPRDQTCVSCTGRWILYHWATREAHSEYLWGIKMIWSNNLIWHVQILGNVPDRFFFRWCIGKYWVGHKVHLGLSIR